MQFLRTSIYFIIMIIIVLSSVVLEQFFFSHNQKDVFILTTDSTIDGLLAQESSDQLPGANTAVASNYYWTKPDLFVHFWPIPAQQRIVKLRYYTPFGAVSVVTPIRSVAQIPQSTTIRVGHILTPAESQFDLTFRANTPQKVDKRTVGMMFLTISWQAVSDNLLTVPATQIPALVGGIPVSMLLLCVLFLCLGTPKWSIPIVALSYLIALTIVYLYSPWHTTAIQPTVQFVACIGLAGVAGGALWQRVKQSAQTSYIIIGVVWMLSTLLFFSPAISSDGVGYYAYIRSYGIDGDWQFANEFDKTQSPLPSIATFPVYAPTGYMINPWSIGPAIIWAPFWYIAHGVTLLTNFIGGDWEVDGYTIIYRTLITFSSNLAGLLTLYLVYLLLIRWFSTQIALLTTITLYLASNWLYYTQIAGSYPHGFVGLFAILTVLTAFKILETPVPKIRDWIYFGLSIGFLVLCYWMNILIGVFPLGIVIYKLWPLLRQREWKLSKTYMIGIVITILFVLIVLLPQFITWRYLYHSWFIRADTNPLRLVPSNFQLIPFFFGSIYGIMWWTPGYFWGILGSVWFAIKRPWPGLLFLLTMIVFISYNVAIPNWEGSGAFGFRRITCLIPFFAIGLATIFQALQRWRLLPVVLASIMGGWSLRIMVRYMDFKFFRAPDNFLDTLTASMLSEQVMPSAAFGHQVTNSLFINQLLHPNWMGVIVVVILVALTVGIYFIGWHRLPRLDSTNHTNTR